MSTAAKKPPAGRDTTSTPSASPSRGQAKNSTPSSNATGPNGPARTRSVRSNTPVSTRAAVHQRRESLLHHSNSNTSSEADEAARAEAAAQREDLMERLNKAEGSSGQYQRQAEVLQCKLDEALQEQIKLEEKVHESEEQIEALRNAKREAARQMQQMEAIYEAERSSMVKEKEEMANREEEMQTVIQRLKDSLAQRTNGEDDIRPGRQSQNNSPSVDSGSFAPPSSIQRSDSRNNSKLLLQKDKLIESLRLELAEAQIKLVESENQGGGRLHEVERLLMEARMANARLMEDNESYQLLLSEKTLKGDFGASDLAYMGGASSNQDALDALEGKTGGSSLADELSEATENESESYRRLELELKAAKDQNKALTLYINKIIERLLQHQEFEHILDTSSDPKPANINKDLPAPPNGTAQSLLQRAKSIAMQATTNPAPTPASPQAPPSRGGRPRPMSFMHSAAGAGSAHNNPETAPSIPIGLGRNTSVRRAGGRPMSEQFTTGMHGPGAASVVNAMYKGPEGPLSPTLRSSANFNFISSSSSAASGQRTPSGSVGMSSSGNFPGMKSETSSVSGESAAELGTPSDQSPPRQPSTHSHEKTAFTGTKPRPLRLVQENSDHPNQPNHQKRASWIGWAFGKKEDGSTAGPGTETIKE